MSVVFATWQEGFLAVLPAVTDHAQFRFRKYRTEQREELIQEAIAAACMNYQLAAVQGKLDVVHATTLARFAVRHVRSGRHTGGRQNTARDVLAPTCQKRQGICVESFNTPLSSDGKTAGWKQIAIASRRTKIPELAAFRIDFSAWLKSFTCRDRRIIAALVRGDRTFEVAEKFAVTEGRITQLRRRFEHDWAVFQQQAV